MLCYNDNDSNYGYTYEVGVVCLSEHQNLHNDFPFCAENKKVGGSKCAKLNCHWHDF